MEINDSSTIAPEWMKRLHAWKGRSEVVDDEIARAPLRGLAATLGRADRGIDATSEGGAVRKGDRYVVSGQKVWISRIQHSDLVILLARTTPLSEGRKRSEGMGIFLVDLHQAIGRGMTVRPIMNMVNHGTNGVFFDTLEIPAGIPTREIFQGVGIRCGLCHPRSGGCCCATGKGGCTPGGDPKFGRAGTGTACAHSVDRVAVDARRASTMGGRSAWRGGWSICLWCALPSARCNAYRARTPSVDCLEFRRLS